MHTPPVWKFALAGLTLAGALAAQRNESDAIRLSNGQTLRPVEVVSETLKEVAYKRRGRDQTVPSEQVVAIEWGETGEAYSRGVFALDRGDFGLAANLFQEAADKTARDAFKAHAGFKAAESLYLSATTDRAQGPVAAQAMQSWLQAHPEHRMWPRAQQLLGQAWLAAGNPDSSLQAFDALEKASTEKGFGASWIARAKFGRGEALVAKKDFQSARQAYLSASATLSTVDPAADPTVVPLISAAKVGEGECYIAEQRYGDAKNFFNTLSRQAGTEKPGLVAAAKAGEAQAMFEEAVANKDTKAIREAQVLFAEVSATDLMDGDASAKAAYFLGRILLTLGKDGEGSDFGTRADALFQSVVDQYPNNRWAVDARQALKK